MKLVNQEEESEQWCNEAGEWGGGGEWTGWGCLDVMKQVNEEEESEQDGVVLT